MNFDEMINGCINKDVKSQILFFEYYHKRLRRIATRFSPKDEIIDDFVQETFIRIFNKLHTLDKINKAIVYSWSRKILINMILDYIRKEKNKSHKVFNFSSEFKFIENLPYVEDILDETLFQEKDIKEAIDSLSPIYSKVFDLYTFKGYTHKQISEELKITIGSSKSNLSKAKRNLRNELSLC
jgi:RNA polymerase sigma factor (sigma-70 family)